MTNENLIQRLTKLLPNGGNSVVGITFSEKALALIQSFREEAIDECKATIDDFPNVPSYGELMDALDQLKQGAKQ